MISLALAPCIACFLLASDEEIIDFRSGRLCPRLLKNANVFRWKFFVALEYEVLDFGGVRIFSLAFIPPNLKSKSGASSPHFWVHVPLNFGLNPFPPLRAPFLSCLPSMALYIHLYSSSDSHERNITNNDK